MSATVILAHGGTVGLALEVGFVLVPIVIFVVLSRASKRRREQATDASGEEATD